MSKSVLLIGSFLFLAGIVLYGFMHLAIALNSDIPGGLSNVLSYIEGWTPYVFSIFLIISGASLIVAHVLAVRQKELSNRNNFHIQ